jgi:hypothetical protein
MDAADHIQPGLQVTGYLEMVNARDCWVLAGMKLWR